MRRLGFAVEVTETGDRALEAFENAEIDVVLMDVQMPVMDGFEAAQGIRTIERTRATRTPIIAMTARALQGDREKCLGAGMDFYLSKPF